MDGFTGYARIERTALPSSGGVWEQDAKTMSAMETLSRVAYAVIVEQRKEHAKRERVKTSRQARYGKPRRLG